MHLEATIASKSSSDGDATTSPCTQGDIKARHQQRTAMKLGLVLVLAFSLLAAACSKTRTWEEEVLLNTGEKIWVRRSQSYSLTGGAGNPADLAYRPDSDSEIEFDWRGVRYRYLGDANLMVLAISPDGVPVLVADAAGNSWNWRHSYGCTLPFYVQLAPSSTGDSWTWPFQIETWLYGLPANLFISFEDPSNVRSRYSIEDKRRQPYLFDPRLRAVQMVDPHYIGDLCKRGGGRMGSLATSEIQALAC